MGGGDQLSILAVLGRAWGSLLLRPYVFGFLVVYLAAAAAAWGWRRAVAFTGLGRGLAFAAEWSSTRIGVPFGLYHYTGSDRRAGALPLERPVLRPPVLHVPRLREPRPRRPAPRLGEAGQAGRGARLRLAGLTGLLMMWLDVVIDPLAVRGDRWFLGRIFYYPEPGWYFGVPIANFAGWVVVGAAIAWGWTVLGPRVGGARPAWGRAGPGTGTRRSSSTTSCSRSTWR